MHDDNDENIEPVNGGDEVDTSMDSYEDEPIISAPIKTVIDFGADYREPFVSDDTVPVRSIYNRFYSNNIINDEVIRTTYPDIETSPESGYAVVVAGMVLDFEVKDHKKYVGVVSNIISHTDEDGITKKVAPAKSKPKFDGSSITGESAVLAITSTMGYTPRIKIPLVNSGFSIEIRRPTGDDTMILDEMLLASKGEFGRITVGSSMGFSSVYMQRDIVSTILRLTISHNLDMVPQNKPSELYKYIKSTDYDSLLTGYMATNHPDGLETNVPCMGNGGKCANIVTGYTLPPRLWNVDHGRLTDYQLDHITRPMGSKVTVEEYDKYQSEFAVDTDTYEFTRGQIKYKFKYKVPTLEESIRSGCAWAGKINKVIGKYISSSEDTIVRKRVMGSQISTNVLSQYGGWFESIELVDTETNERMAIVEDSETIVEFLKDLYSDESVSDSLDAVRDFIANSNPVTCGVKNVSCPVCRSKVGGDDRYLVPLDMQNLFFIHSADRQVLANHLDLMDIVG